MSTAARLISAALLAAEAIQAVEEPDHLPRANKALSHYATVIAVTPPAEQALAMASRDEQGQLVPTFLDTLQAYFQAVSRAHGQYLQAAGA